MLCRRILKNQQYTILAVQKLLFNHNQNQPLVQWKSLVRKTPQPPPLSAKRREKGIYIYIGKETSWEYPV